MSTTALTRILAAIALVAISSVAFAQDVGVAADVGGSTAAQIAAPFDAALVKQSAPSEPIHAGETVQVTFELTHPAGATIEFPEVYSPDRWVLVEAAPMASPGAEGASTSTWVATFAVLRPGITTLQPFDIGITDAAKNSTTVRTEPVEAKVLSIFADTADEPQFKDPRSPVEVWVEDYTLAYVGGSGLLLALLGLIAFAIRRRQQMIPPPPPPPRAAHEVALEKLGALAGDDLVERGEYMIYWVRMSEAVREYLGRTYGFPGTELTTTEMLDVLERVTWPTGLGFEDLRSFLRRCDEVKFGGAEPGVDESTATLRRAFTVVELTKPRPRAEGEELKLAGDSPPDDVATEEKPRSKWAPPHDKRPSEKQRERKRKPRSEKEGERKRKPRSDEDGERKRKPRSDKDGERKRKPRSDRDGERKRKPRSEKEGERKRRPRSEEDSERRRRSRSDEDGERKRRRREEDGEEPKRKPRPKPPTPEEDA